MEVHHHPHVEKKSFKEYFLEFVMIFLAVMLGFLAENFRERQADKQREHEFIESLVSDLKDDTLKIERQLTEEKRSIQLFDSLAVFIDSPGMALKKGDDIYYAARMGNRRPPLLINNRTIDQLTHSGGFRVIRKSETSNRIMDYYSQLPLLRTMESIFNDENNAYKHSESMVIDPAVFRRQENRDGFITRSTDNPRLLTYDPIQLKQMEFEVVQMNGSRRGMIPLVENLKKTAIDLIKYLDKTYQLK